MNEVNKTLYIPLYGKSEISRRGIIINDKKAEEIWEKEGFKLNGKARSKWLALFMSMRAAVFDEWTVRTISKYPDAVVLHIGCGLDSRIVRVGNSTNLWFDIDFPDVIAERKKYFSENAKYTMFEADASETGWIGSLPDAPEAVIVMEGISMYLGRDKCRSLFEALSRKYGRLFILADVYTVFAAKASKYKNPINDVGVTEVYGIDSPDELETEEIRFKAEHSMTPPKLVDQLQGFERSFFNTVFAGKTTKKIYRLFEFEKI
ncbi:MAG: class I SAM-dependent methyltransferase [Oscillospiraceae bacterium]|nr:class I SAM-dependent methyltransferase [Oscillospiraceae bacterium]MDY6209387.1 class I SAM-dependent methyltransferase [Oscillospiraceae bacterium]